MHIECEAISSKHAFCIEKTSVKQLFDNYDVDISFKKGNVLPYKNAKVMPQKSAKFKVATLHVSKPRSTRFGTLDFMRYPLLIFYSVDKKYLSEKLKEQFSREIMLTIFDRFIRHKDDDYESNGCEYSLFVYISEDGFEIEEWNNNSF